MKERERRRKGKGIEKKIKCVCFSVYFFPFDCNLMPSFISSKGFFNSNSYWMIKIVFFFLILNSDFKDGL